MYQRKTLQILIFVFLITIIVIGLFVIRQENYQHKAENFAINKQYEKALEYYDLAIQKNQHDLKSYLAKGKILSQELKKYQEAHDVFVQAIENANTSDHKTLSSIYFYKALSLVVLNQIDQALNDFDMAIQYDNSEQITIYTAQIDILHSLKEYSKALEKTNQLILLDPNNMDTYNLKGCILRDAHKYDEAIEVFNVILAKDPEYYLAYYNQALAFEKLHNFSEALKRYELAIHYNSQHCASHLYKGLLLYYALNRNTEALQDVSNAIKIKPDLYIAYVLKANILSELGDHKNALKTLDELISINPKYSDAYLEKGEIFNKITLHKEAIENFDLAIKYNPDDWRNYFNKAMALSILDLKHSALEAYNMSIKFNPNHCISYYNKGVILSDLKKYHNAIEAYDLALKCNPHHSDAYNNKGYVLVQLKNDHEAIKLFNLALKANPKNAAAIRNKKIYHAKYSAHKKR